MTAIEILTQLETLGEASIKKVLLKHSIPEPLFGVKVEELKKIRKAVKENHTLALELYDSGIYDAMYLAGLLAQPGKMTPSDLQCWAEKATCPAIREYTVAWVAAESGHGLLKALEWIDSPDEGLASVGWSTLSSLVTIANDADLNMAQLEQLLQRAQRDIHGAPNRVKLAMNGYVMAVGI
ncbi:MAG: DNA alkylation repair protein, partial [Chitinophagia bacterium]|nr:DNA alkylation repair protein [Chitinophagia bacterium]